MFDLRAALRLASWLLAIALAFAPFAAAAEPPSAPEPQIQTAMAFVPVVPIQRPAERAFQPRRVVDTRFVSLNALALGLTVADIEVTQHCLARRTCHELNSLLPHSRVGMYAVNLPVNVGAMYLGYRLKKSGRRTWWIAPAIVSGSHGVGAAFTF